MFPGWPRRAGKITGLPAGGKHRRVAMPTGGILLNAARRARYTMAVTIRHVLLRAFIALVLGAIALEGAVSFFQLRQALQTEIAHHLQFTAVVVMQRIDAFFFERLEIIRVWRRLEVMQDIRVDDGDKRLARFLSDLQAGHGDLYRALLCTTRDGRVVAASDGAWLGRLKPPEVTWIKAPASEAAEVVLESIGADAAGVLAMRTAIPDAFGKGELGYLYILLDWREVLDLLDEAVAGSARGALLLDGNGRTIAASAGLRRQSGIYGLNLTDWYSATAEAGVRLHNGAPLGYDNLLVSGARSTGYQHFPGFGWRLLIVEPTASAFAPIWQLLGAMLVVLLFTLAVALWIASRLADRITRPIIALTDSTRRYRRGERAVPFTSSAGMIEVGELSQAFGEMIGALERSREQIVRAGKLAVVGEMAAIMVHEVRTPLGILRSSAQLLGRQAQLDAKGRELIGFIVSDTDRLNRLVTLLLATASPRAPDFLPHDLNEIIDHVLALLAAKAENKGVQLQRELTPQGTTLVCDREQIIQVFLNLVINALHFVPAGGRIKISTCAEDGMLVASVADDGPGIPAELRARIFDPFFMRREGGSGLGLTIVQQIVQVHHAEIDAAESEWGGASFRVRFDTRRGDANGSA